MRKLTLQVFHSFHEADKCQLDEALAMRPEDRVSAVDEIRKRLYLTKGIKADNIVDRKHITFAKRGR